MKHYSLISPQQWMLPILQLAFIGLGVSFITPIFNVTTRWLILGTVATYLIFSGELLKPLKSKFGNTCLILIIWTILTTIWSELPELSGLKALAFLLIVPASLACGMLWVKNHEFNESLDYLIPLLYVTILAGILGNITGNGAVQLNDSVQLYKGAVDAGPNMFGSMISMCAPLLIWKVYTSSGRSRIYWVTLLFTALFYLLASKARSSFLSVICTVMFFYMGYSKRNKTFIVLAFSLVAIVMYFILPDFVKNLERDYINKHGVEESILYSRTSVWNESYAQALKGGVMGGGYGVTIGDSNLTLGFSVSNYGREKSNSQLAILEETGFVGLALYAIVIFSLFSTLRRGFRRCQMGPQRLQFLLVTGTIAGMLVKSAFEAWWVAPSSPESVYFWSLVGVALGLCTVRRKQEHESEIH